MVSKKLEKLDYISTIAKTHTSYMVETGKVDHTNFNIRKEKLVTEFGAKNVGENIAYGYKTAEGVVRGWLNSEKHRKNILNANYTHFGISNECNKNGNNYYTQLFIEK